MKPRVVTALFLGLIGLGGCGPSQLQLQFAKQTGCGADNVEVRKEANPAVETFQVSGCSRVVRYYCMQGKCRSAQFEVVRRHAYQHGCDEAGIGAMNLGDDLFMVDGCGHKTQYQCSVTPQTVVKCTEKSPQE